MAKHQLRKWVSLAGKAVGAALVFTPSIRAVNDAFTNASGLNAVEYLPSRLLYYNTGYDTNTGNIDTSITTQAVASFAGGLIVMKLFSYVARRF